MTIPTEHFHRFEPATRVGLPVLLLLHGTGGDEHDLIPLGGSILPGAAMLSVRGNVLERGAPRFFRRLAEGVFDLPDLHHRTGVLAGFVEAAAAHYGFLLTQLYAIGYSNGANIAASLLISHPGVMAGAVLIRVMSPFDSEAIPDLSGKQILISAGLSDQMISRSGTEHLAEFLRSAGARVHLTWQATQHGLIQADVQAGRDFFAGIVVA